MISAFRRASIFGQVHRSLRALRIELPQVILVIDQQRLVVGCPAGGSVRAGIVGHIVQHIPSSKGLRRSQFVERAVRHRAGVPAAVGLAIPVRIFAGRRETITPIIGRGECLAGTRLHIDRIIVAAGTSLPHRRKGVRGRGREQRQCAIALVGQLQIRQLLIRQLHQRAFTDVIYGTVVLFQILCLVVVLYGILHRLVPAPHLYVGAILRQLRRVFLTGLRRRAEIEACAGLGELQRAMLADHPIGGESLIATSGNLLGGSLLLREVERQGLVG